jgi:hypothetical protein
MTTSTASTPELAICEGQSFAVEDTLSLDLAGRAMDDLSLTTLSVLAREYADAFLAQLTWFFPYAGEWAQFNGAAVRDALPAEQGPKLIQAISDGFLAVTEDDRMAADARAESVLQIAVGNNPDVLLNLLPGFEQTNAVL